MKPVVFIAFALATGCTVGAEPPLEDPCSGFTDRSTDTDGDGLSDEFESADDRDWDGDGVPDALDEDSDGDGESDRDESGRRGACAARDSDNDGYPDFRDNDSDDDGLSDREERQGLGSDPRDRDSDDDGFDDASEFATGHDPTDEGDRLADDDYYVVLPYRTTPEIRALGFRTSLRRADVFFQMDRTYSMIEEVRQLKAGLAALVERITVTIPDVGVGFAGFEDFDYAGYGSSGTVPYQLLSPITTDPAQMIEDVALLQVFEVGATWASSAEALYQTATGEGVSPWVPSVSCPLVLDEPGLRYGAPCFRPGAQPIIVTITDSSSRNGPLTEPSQDYDAALFPVESRPHTFDETVAALDAIGARVLGVLSGSGILAPSSYAQFGEWARLTGTVDAEGEPLLFRIEPDGTGLTDRIAEAIEDLALQTPHDVGTRKVDGVDVPAGAEPVDATRMIRAITPRTAALGGRELSAEELARDERTFYQVVPGTNLFFDVSFYNDVVPSGATAAVFVAKIVVVGNGVVDLDEHDVAIVVPAASSLIR